MNHKLNICKKFILFNDIFIFLPNFLIEAKNNNLNFNKFIINYKAINLEFSQNKYKELSDIKSFRITYNANEYIIKHIFKKKLEKIRKVIFSCKYLWH